jgi:hypothetical protein
MQQIPATSMPRADDGSRAEPNCAHIPPPVASGATLSPARGGGLGRGLPRALVAGIALAGFALTVFVFHPGVMTHDARYVYTAIAEGKVGDWQSPVMTALWAAIDPLAPGSASMFLFTAALYWLGFALIGITLARRAPWRGILAVLLAFTPPAFMFVGIIWRDVLFAVTWLFATALAFSVAESRAAIRLPAQAAALALIALGVTLRTNALFAAPILIVYSLWPAGFAWKRTALAYVPIVLVLYGLVQVVYYGMLGAERQHPLHSLYVFDLGGITHFSKANQFPAAWSAAEQRRLVTDCYDPYLWDAYWYGRPCSFVMRRLEREQQIFGTPILGVAWRHALLSHPAAYLQHRAAFMGTFLFGSNFTVWTQDVGDPSKLALAGNRGFVALVAVHDSLKPTPLFRGWLWFALCIVVFGLACRLRTSPLPNPPPHAGEGVARQRGGRGPSGRQPSTSSIETPAGAFALATSGSAIIYVLTYAPFGVAADFRYAYWAVLAALAGGVALTKPTPPPA